MRHVKRALFLYIGDHFLGRRRLGLCSLNDGTAMNAEYDGYLARIQYEMGLSVDEFFFRHILLQGTRIDTECVLVLKMRIHYRKSS